MNPYVVFVSTFVGTIVGCLLGLWVWYKIDTARDGS